MSLPERLEEKEVVIPTGEIVSLAQAGQVAQALDSLRKLEQQIRDAKAELTWALVEHSMREGTKTLSFPDGHQAVIRGGSETVYDAEEIAAGLLAAGMPAERVNEIVYPLVNYKVNAAKAKAAAAANPAYKEVIEAHSRQVEKRHTIELK